MSPSGLWEVCGRGGVRMMLLGAGGGVMGPAHKPRCSKITTEHTL